MSVDGAAPAEPTGVTGYATAGLSRVGLRQLLGRRGSFGTVVSIVVRALSRAHHCLMSAYPERSADALRVERLAGMGLRQWQHAKPGVDSRPGLDPDHARARPRALAELSMRVLGSDPKLPVVRGAPEGYAGEARPSGSPRVRNAA
ncbi:hypothetical protein GCM10009849_25810 [Sinomonas flava]|uniref:Uncharacterized protein n=1 Tax=Sinomonas flava TaxID=496857 RepID=A0ABN3BX66_9MICC